MDKEYIISSSERLDVFLTEQNSEFTRSHIKHLIVDGKVTVNGKVVKAGYILCPNDVVKCFDWEQLKQIDAKPENIALDIVYEDNDIAIINKPKGMVVHPAIKNETGTLVNALLYHIKDLSGINGAIRPGIVHRLDKDTTGLLVIAKNDSAHVKLSREIQSKECHRIYLAIVEGVVKDDFGEIETFIDRSKRNRLKMCVSDKGRLAKTNYKVLERFSHYTYMEFELKTGRTHQIRCHCEHIHHPIVGDKLYGSVTKKCYENGQYLHAYKLILTHPTTGKVMEFTADIPQYMQDFLLKQRQSNLQ